MSIFLLIYRRHRIEEDKFITFMKTVLIQSINDNSVLKKKQKIEKMTLSVNEVTLQRLYLGRDLP